MRVLALHVGPDSRLALAVVVQASCACALHGAEVGVHGAGDGAPGAVALIVGEACGVESSDAVHDGAEVVAAAALVAGAPDDDGGVVTQGQHLAHAALHHGLAEGFLAGETHIAVALHVGLGQHVQTQAVAEVIEVGVVGVVRGADGVDVQSFHLHDVGLYLLLGEGSSAVLAEAVAVHSVEDDAVAVDQQGSVGADADCAQSHLQRADVHGLASLLQGDHEVIELRAFGAPGGDARDVRELELGIALGIGRGGLCGQHARSILELCLDGGSGGRGAAEADGQRGLGLGVVRLEGRGAEEEIADMGLRSAPEVHVARDTRQSPVVLALEEGTGGEAIDAHTDIVHARANLISNIELAGEVAVLGVAHELSVDPDVISVAGTVEAEEHLAPVPSGRQRELAAIAAHGVLLGAGVGEPSRALGHDAPGRLVVAEGVAGVHVQGFVPRLSVTYSIDLPGGRHLDVVPGTGVEAVLEEGVAGTFRGAHPLELPGAVEAEEIGRRLEGVGRRVGGSSFRGRGHGDVECVGAHAVEVRDADVIPFFQGLTRDTLDAAEGYEGAHHFVDRSNHSRRSVSFLRLFVVVCFGCKVSNTFP